MSFEFEIFNEKNCDKLISFTAELKAGAVELAWLIDADAFYRGFEVQRSREDGRYKRIGFVQENGKTTEAKSYTFLDENITKGSYSYRLKQITNDGTFEYSNEVRVEALTSL